MKIIYQIVLSILVFIHIIRGATIKINNGSDSLILTPFIENNQINQARRAAKVDPANFLGVESYSGYFTVNKKYNSNHFFWFFPAEKHYENAPVLLWLEGGPGVSSMYGLFTESGPFVPISNATIGLREHRWSKKINVLYIDNPVGVGFSFTDAAEGYCEEQTRVGEELYQSLVQFYTLFPELQRNSFYAAGESYAGKYVPAVCYTIHQRNPAAALKINLKGMAIGNGFCDPINQLNHGDYLYQLGLVDAHGRALFKEYERSAVDRIGKGDYMGAFKVFEKIIYSAASAPTTLFRNLTTFTNPYNYLIANDPRIVDQHMLHFLAQAAVRAAIHVGSRDFNDGSVAESRLRGDIMRSVAPWIGELLDHYRVMMFSGQVDVIVAYPLTEAFLQRLPFNGAAAYRTAQRRPWFVGAQLAGYVKTAANLAEVLVRNAGHMVPEYQPRWAEALMLSFVSDELYNSA